MIEKNNQDLVDILVATYNTNIEYLKQQLDSILSQDYNNIHVIISDDCSTKKEVIDILKQYEKNDSRIELYIQNENLGYLKNFEFLLTKSKANYISYSDHDDIWYKNKISKNLEVLKNKNVDLVYCDAKQIDEKGQVLQESYLKYKNMPVINGENNILAFSRHIAIGCSELFTKKIKEQMLPFTDNMMAHDWINMYLASKENGVACIEEPLFEYRLHGNNEFGGRSLKQNLSKWKKENGNSYKAYKKYRNESITRAYLNGALMCNEYNKKLNKNDNQDSIEEKVIDYYKKINKTKVINIRIDQYKKYLSFKEIGKRELKEIALFHFPLISYLLFLVK